MSRTIASHSLGSTGLDSRRGETVSRFGPTRAQSRRLTQYAELTGLEFTCVDPFSGVVLGASAPGALSTLPAAAREDLRCVPSPVVRALGDSLLCGILPMPDVDFAPAVAVTLVVRDPESLPPELVLAAVEEGWNQHRLDAWAVRQCCPQPRFLRSLLQMCHRESTREDEVHALVAELTEVRRRLDRTDEEIGVLHSLSHNLHLARGTAEAAEQSLTRLHCLLECGGSAVWLEESRGAFKFLVKGTLPFDDLGLAHIAARFEEHDWTRPLIRNGIEHTLLGADFPGLRNILVAPIGIGAHRSGWIACCNLPPGREFGEVEGTLVSSVARMLGTHVRNQHLDSEQESMLLSFVRSLVCTIDAKDPHTRGHSERVAIIARRLGEQLGLPEEDLRDIYLSGLLHDVGKIGVDDRILRNTGRLSEDEFRKVQQHPSIGYSILVGLKSLRRILPGVRNHHEMVNGCGYPDGLKGAEIPMMARIIAVADAYDAMVSDRPYRKGIPVEKFEAIFQKEAGRQWDTQVIDAYFACADEIRRLCASYCPTQGPLLPSAEEM